MGKHLSLLKVPLDGQPPIWITIIAFYQIIETIEMPMEKLRQKGNLQSWAFSAALQNAKHPGNGLA
jgi:hypothetical protein